MQYIDRSRVIPPLGLITSDIVKKDLANIEAFLSLEPQQRSQTRPPHLSISSSKVEGLKETLHKLFNGRCAFCESKKDVLYICRFRTSSNAHPMDKNADAPLYYLWFVWAWQNLYLLCKECNMSLRDTFPVQGKRMSPPSFQEYQDYVRGNSSLWPQWPPKENNLLLDPCQMKLFVNHFIVRPQGDFKYKSRKGMATINILNLNNSDLIQRRVGRYNEYFKLMFNAITTCSKSTLSKVLDFDKLEFGGSWYLLLRRLASHIDIKKGHSLSVKKLPDFFISMLQEPITGLEKLHKSLEVLLTESSESQYKEFTSLPKGRLKHLHFKNFKSLEMVRLDLQTMPEPVEGQKPEAQALLIIGENAAGKSTILEGIALALASSEGRAKLNLSLKDFIISPELLGGDILTAPETAEIKLTQDNGISQTLTLKGNSAISSDNKLFNVGPVFAYSAFRQYREGRRQYAADKTIRNLFDGSLLGNPKSWLSSLSDINFDRVVAALREVLSIEGEFNVIQRSPEKKECYIITAIDDIQTRTPLNLASSGFRTVLAMVCDIMQGLMDSRIEPEFQDFENARGVVLIDEVEAHLHPRWKMQIIGGLRRALPRMTFIITTHDPLCLRGMYNGEVIVMQRSLQDNLVLESKKHHKIETLSELPDINKLRVDQLLTSDFFQLDSTDEPGLIHQMARIADLLVKHERGDTLTAEESDAISTFERDIASAMPVGTSEAHRLVQEVVAKYLQERRQVSVQKMHALQDSTRSHILNILREITQ